MRYAPVPKKPVDLDEAMRLFPEIHQSLAGAFDDCPLSALFKVRYGQGYFTKDQARGQIFHRFCASALREMQRQDSESIPVGVALAILEETLRQKDVEPEEIVRVPFREIPMLRMAASKWAKDNSFSVRRIAAVEERLRATLSYQRDDGVTVERTLTGQLDLLIAVPPDEAIVVDWKDTWGLPPEKHEDSEDPGLSYSGYFQLLFYAWLVMKVFKNVEAVTFREFYGRRTKARKGRVTRADLEEIEKRLVVLVEAFDRAVAAGSPPRLTVEAVEEHGHWKPSPGKHCYNCDAMHRCPIDKEAALPSSIRNPKDASRWAAMRQVAVAIKKRSDLLLRPYTEANGPIPLRASKGRRVLGHRTLAGGKVRFEEFTPEGSDRPPSRTAATDKPLEDAMREAAARARAG